MKTLWTLVSPPLAVWRFLREASPELADEVLLVQTGQTVGNIHALWVPVVASAVPSSYPQHGLMLVHIAGLATALLASVPTGKRGLLLTGLSLALFEGLLVDPALPWLLAGVSLAVLEVWKWGRRPTIATLGRAALGTGLAVAAHPSGWLLVPIQGLGLLLGRGPHRPPLSERMGLVLVDGVLLTLTTAPVWVYVLQAYL